MCTVTYVPLKEGFTLTSNRDEQSFRKTIIPQSYRFENVELIFPKDTLAGGSWIAVDKNNRKAACLLNGAFVAHERKAAYRKSRGLILLESFFENSFEAYTEKLDLEGIEPFTLLFFDYSNELNITELRWDENQKYVKGIDPLVPIIWSSAPLYTPHQREIREKWFTEWLKAGKLTNKDAVLKFHNGSFTEDETTDLVMKRNEYQLQTVSISQLVVSKEEHSFSYLDKLDNSLTVIDLQ